MINIPVLQLFFMKLLFFRKASFPVPTFLLDKFAFPEKCLYI